MAYITLNTEKLKHNYKYLEQLFDHNNIQWSVVSKMLCGNEQFLRALIDLGVKQICDSRIVNLKMIKSVSPDVETIFIKPPSSRNVKNVIRYADISLNTSYATVKRLSEEAAVQNKVHKIIVMVELGERREGVLKNNLVRLCGKIFNLPNIEIVGLGANLTCMYGVLPDYGKLAQLCELKAQVEEIFDRKLEYVSGGASVTIPLVQRGQIPEAVNHFRVGETLFLGTDVYSSGPLKGMNQDVFELHTEIIELYEKPNTPSGKMGFNLAGETVTMDENIAEKSFRAIVDIGLLDVEEKHICPEDETIRIAGASSDMLVLDLGKNLNNYKVGDTLKFRTSYMGTLRLMHSKYIDKRLETSLVPVPEPEKQAVLMN